MREPAGLQLAMVAPLTQSGRVENGPSAYLQDDTLHRLASWLADVSAEAASVVQTGPTPLAPRRPRAGSSR